MVSPLGKAIEFLRDFGLFDIVLPFLLVFTLVFAILEKTRILGTVKYNKEEIPNKNINAMVAFVVGLLVVATANVVRTINESLPNVIVLVVVSVSFLLMLGVFMKTGEFDFKGQHPKWHKAFVLIMFVAVVLIFLNSIYIESGDSWLELGVFFLVENLDTAIVGSLILLILIMVTIWNVTKNPTKKEEA